MGFLKSHFLSLLFLFLVALEIIPFEFFWPMLGRLFLSAAVIPEIFLKVDRWYWGAVLFFATLFHFIF